MSDNVIQLNEDLIENGQSQFGVTINMKKFKMFYVIAMILSFILHFTKGFSANMIIHSYNDRMIDGFQGDVLLSIFV